MNTKVDQLDPRLGSREKWRKPELKELGNINRIVQTGDSKSGLCDEGGGVGGGEETRSQGCML